MTDAELHPYCPVVASLEHLTGPASGHFSWLSGPALDVYLDPNRIPRVREATTEEMADDVIARLHLSGDRYELEAPANRPVWINGSRVNARTVNDCDIVEFGEQGPLSRFRLHNEQAIVRKTLGDIGTDWLDYLRVSRRPLRKRLTVSLKGILRRLVRETSLLFRIAVVAAFAVVAALYYQQYRLTSRLEQTITAGEARLDRVAQSLVRTSEEVLRPGDLDLLRQELAQRMTSNQERLELLERRSAAARRVIAQSVPSIGFIQGSYAFREITSGMMLRYVLDKDGNPTMLPYGRPMLTVEGDGAVAEINFTGTGFLAGDPSVVVTNRHVALPWEQNAPQENSQQGGLEPVLQRLLFYLPGWQEALSLTLEKASEESDLAMLRIEYPDNDRDERPAMTGLRLASASPSPGDEILVMGYPTGLRSLLAQSGDAFIERLQAGGELDFWTVAEELASENLIAPLASRGIVATTTPSAVIYDAETTHGGSGGPVLNNNGEVIAVNTAVLPEYGGSNIGIPIDRLRKLLDDGGF